MMGARISSSSKAMQVMPTLVGEALEDEMEMMGEVTVAPQMRWKKWRCRLRVRASDVGGVAAESAENHSSRGGACRP